MYIPRIIEPDIRSALQHNPAVAILGPRQCGKSTLVKHLLRNEEKSLYLDLERPSDQQKLVDPEWFLSTQSQKLVCLDEVQRMPEIFPLLRSLIDEQGRKGMYVILGSASHDLIRQSSESLAGRIHFHRLTPFLFSEVQHHVDLETYLSRGGFPRSILADEEDVSFRWREDFISTFLERDLLQFAGFTPITMRRLWQMLAHLNGQTANYSKLGDALGISHTTVRKYIDLLEGTFMLTQLPPYYANTKKRLIKSPKVYLSDTGIVAALLQLRDFNQLAGHPVMGTLWEGLVLQQLKGHFPNLEYSFYRTNHGHEIDIVVMQGSRKLAIECKASSAPSLSKGNYKALDDIHPEKCFVLAPVPEGYSMHKSIEVVAIHEFIEKMSAWISAY